MPYEVIVKDDRYEVSTSYGEFTEYSAAETERDRLNREIEDEGEEEVHAEIVEIH